MHSFGLALTLSLLTGTFVALDLSDVHGSSSKQPVTQASNTSSFDDSVNALSVMPNSLSGIYVPKADISDGIFAVGSSTGKEGLEGDEHEAASHTTDVDAEADAMDSDEAANATDAADAAANRANDFVLI